MSDSHTPRAVLAAALISPLVLTGCGGGSPSTAGSRSTTNSIAEPPAPTTTAAGSASTSTQDPVPPEDNPPGDIPDDLAFVAYTNGDGDYAFTHPEGWARTEHGSAVTFTDKLNGVHVETGAATTAPSVAQTRSVTVPALTTSQPAFELRAVDAAKVSGWSGVHVVYRRNSEPDSVTGRQYRDEVERYELVKDGRELIVELYGPVGADNVDAYRTMLDSLALT